MFFIYLYHVSAKQISLLTADDAQAGALVVELNVLILLIKHSNMHYYFIRTI